MSATSRLKQLLFIIAGLALVVVGLTSLTTAAQADDTQSCEPIPDEVVTDWFETDPGAPWVATGNSRVKTEGSDPSLSAWVNEGDVIRTEENVAPADPDGTDEGSFTNLIRFVFVGETDPEVVTPAIPGGHYSWNGGNRGVNDPPTVVPPHADWQLNTDSEPAGHLEAATWSGTPGVGLHVLGNSPSNASWFYTVAGTPAVTDIDYLWQKQVREVVQGTDDVIEYEYTKTIEGVDCPPEECPEESDVEHDALEGEHADDECDEDDDDENCPKGTDNAGQNIDEVESCDEDPIIGPGEGENPGNNPGNNPGSNPSNNPGNSPSANPQGSNLPNNAVTPVSAPGADVPSAVNAGLLPAQDELTGSGNGLGLVGMGTALIGLGLLGLTLRPRRGRRLAG
jgi:hypothetical protein